MKSRNVFFFFMIFLFAVALNFSQELRPESAKWDPAAIGIGQATLVEGTTIEFSATFKILHNVRGLKYEAGVDAAVLQGQNFPGELVAGTAIPVKFKWKAVKGRHSVFFHLILPGTSRLPHIKKLNKTINVVPRMQTPGQDPISQAPAFGEPDLCYGQQTARAKVKIESFSAQYTPANNLVIYSYTIYNDSSRCIRELSLWVRMIYPDGSMRTGLLDNSVIESERPGGWALRSFQRRSLIGSFTPNSSALGLYPLGWSTPCQTNSPHKCLSLRLLINPKDTPGTGDSKEIRVDVGPIEEK